MSSSFVRLESDTFVKVPSVKLHSVLAYQTKDNRVTIEASLSEQERSLLLTHLKDHIQTKLNRTVENIDLKVELNRYWSDDILIKVPKVECSTFVWDTKPLNEVTIYCNPIQLKGEFTISLEFSSVYINLLSSLKGIASGTLVCIVKVQFKENSIPQYTIVDGFESYWGKHYGLMTVGKIEEFLTRG